MFKNALRLSNSLCLVSGLSQGITVILKVFSKWYIFCHPVYDHKVFFLLNLPQAYFALFLFCEVMHSKSCFALFTDPLCGHFAIIPVLASLISSRVLSTVEMCGAQWNFVLRQQYWPRRQCLWRHTQSFYGPVIHLCKHASGTLIPHYLCGVVINACANRSVMPINGCKCTLLRSDNSIGGHDN